MSLTLLPEMLSFLVTSIGFGVNWHDSDSQKPGSFLWILKQVPSYQISNLKMLALIV